ncbi:type IV pilus modification protein PilV [Dasania marina]|uniref:type IV pilus modification protein PilV n=1 Tax=Dasania marina TaxID=471499 RepID=UPI0030D8783B
MKKQQGSGLLEVMIGLFVLAIGLLGMSSMQSKALRSNNTAYMYSQAIFLANDITERIRANRSEVSAYSSSYTDSHSATAACESNNCTAAQIAEWDLAGWKADVAALLPQGKAEITISGTTNDIVKVVVEFDDSRGQNPAIDISMSTQI